MPHAPVSRTAQGGPLIALVAVAAILGFVGVAVATRDHPGVTVDSAEYLAVSQGLRAGHGLTSPYLSFGEPFPDVVRPAARVSLGHFPPLYPVVLAGLGAASGSRSLTASRWLGAASLAAVAALVTLLVGSRSRSLLAAAVAGGLVLAPDLLVAHSMAWTEGLFGLLTVGAVAMLDRHLGRPTRASAVGLVLVAAAAPMTRFAGVAVPLAVALALLVWGRGPSLVRRAGRAAVLGGGALVPVLLWVGLGHGVARSGSGLVWHRPDVAQIHQGFAVVAGWSHVGGPRAWQVGAAALIAVTSVAVAGAARQLHRSRRRPSGLPADEPSGQPDDHVGTGRRRLLGITAIVAATYLFAVVASRLVVDAAIPFDARLLIPMHLMGAIALPLAVTAIDAIWVRRLALVVAGLVAVLGIRDSTRAMHDFPHKDTGYLSARWRRSPGIREIRTLPENTLVVTNAPDPVWLHTGRAPLFIPLRTDLYAARANTRYSRQLRALAAALHDRRAVVVFFRHPTRSGARRIDKRVLTTLHLHPWRHLADATVYRPAPSGSPR